MKKKLTLTMFLLILLSSTIAMTRVEASSSAVVAVSPSTITVQNVNNQFSVEITIADVTSLYGFELKLFYNKTLLEGRYTTLPPGHFMDPVYDPSNRMIAKNSSRNSYNATHNYVWFAYSLLAPEIPRNGSGVLLKVFFKALARGGPSPLVIAYPGNLYPVKLSDAAVNPIPCSSTDGHVTVLPEFPMAILIVMLMAATLIAVVYGKSAWLKKLRSSSIKG